MRNMINYKTIIANLLNAIIEAYSLSFDSEDHKDLPSVLESLHVATFFLPEIKKFSESAYLRTAQSIITQKVKNKLVQTELEHIFKRCEALGIRVINIKGWFLAEELHCALCQDIFFHNLRCSQCLCC